MKKLFLVLFVILLFAFTAVSALAEENASVSDGEVEELDIEFRPTGFLDNLGKMGIGMLGIFIVMGVVIIVTTVLNKVTK